MDQKRGKLIIIVAPSGSGKSTLINKLKKDFPSFEESISYTTRGKRKGDEEGVHYFFTTTQDFEERIKKDEFLEWAKVHSNYYGTSKEFVLNKLTSGKSILLDVDVQGALAIKKILPQDTSTIFIEPPSIKELEERLIKRGLDSIEIIQERLKNAEKELKLKDKFDYKVLNDDLEKAYKRLNELIKKIGT